MATSELNKRQRAFLLAIYETDQAEEFHIRELGARRLQTPPAEEWRWLVCADLDKGAPLHKKLRRLNLIDEGTGSTIKALCDRGLLRRRYDYTPPALKGLLVMTKEPILSVRMTRAGRKLARELKGEKAPNRLPAGTLREWHWRALAKLYSAKSLPSDLRGYGGIGRRTWSRLREYKSGALIEEYVASYSGGELGGWQYAIRLTSAGHTFYKDQRAYYQNLYPSVQAPEP